MLAAVACGIFLAACGDTARGGKDAPTPVSLIQVIADPWRHDGDRVIVIGFLHLEWEGSALYLHEADLRVGIPQNAVRLDLDVNALPAHQRALGGSYVLVEGVYAAERTGPTDIYTGRMGSISRLERWLPPRGPGAPNR